MNFATQTDISYKDSYAIAFDSCYGYRNVNNYIDRVDPYNLILSELLKSHATLKTWVVTARSSAPWVAAEIIQAKAEHAKLRQCLLYQTCDTQQIILTPPSFVR